MIIDIHVHIFADTIAKRAANKLQKTADLPIYTNFTEADTRQKMKEWGVDLGVMLPIATKPTQQQMINDWAITLQKENLICFGSVHPFAQDVLQEVHRIHELGLYGIKLHPDYQRFFADDASLFSMYEEIRGLGLPVIFHAGFDPVSPDISHGCAKRIAHLTQMFPGLKIIAAHLGSAMRYDETEEFLVGKDIYFDTSLSSLYCPPDQFLRIIKNHGPEKILFGSDCPWTLPQNEIDFLQNTGLCASDIDLILYKNAQKLLNL